MHRGRTLTADKTTASEPPSPSMVNQKRPPRPLLAHCENNRMNRDSESALPPFRSSIIMRIDHYASTAIASGQANGMQVRDVPDFGTPLQLSIPFQFSRFHDATHYRNAFKLYVLGLSYDPGPPVGGCGLKFLMRRFQGRGSSGRTEPCPSCQSEHSKT